MIRTPNMTPAEEAEWVRLAGAAQLDKFAPALPPPPRHGRTGYSTHGCRCGLCRGAWAQINRERRARR